jgi:ADP-ribose pyrophosphatase
MRNEQHPAVGADRPEPRDPWQTLSSTVPLRTKWLAVRQDQVRTHTGAEITYTYVDSPRSVMVVPVTEAGEIVLLRQYRYTVRAWCWELPAGAPESGEAGADAAARELREEVGGQARELRPVGTFNVGSGICNQRCEIFLALGVALGECELEPTELLHVVCLPLDDAMRLVRAGQVTDGMTTLSLLLCEPHLRGRLGG